MTKDNFRKAIIIGIALLVLLMVLMPDPKPVEPRQSREYKGALQTCQQEGWGNCDAFAMKYYNEYGPSWRPKNGPTEKQQIESAAQRIDDYCRFSGDDC